MAQRTAAAGGGAEKDGKPPLGEAQVFLRLATEGNLYRGGGARVLRLAPQFAITLSLFAVLKSAL